MGLFNFLKSKKEPLFKGSIFDFHEDEFFMVELLDKETSIDFDFNITLDSPISLLDKKIKLDDLTKILDESPLSKFDNVTTGYGSQQYDSEFSTAYGLERELILIFERDKNFVDKIWFRLSRYSQETEYVQQFTELVSLISKKWDLAMINWTESLIINTKSKKEFSDFLLRIDD